VSKTVTYGTGVAIVAAIVEEAKSFFVEVSTLDRELFVVG
jgi:hypothetical protein